ncbi:MAG: PSD1 and planctomycete cytochrome C domain-containing protein [Planctomycetes bacterium]|nr:PSD1 and planctomycete cytochrome C domain-containing protein [Planctomycetota bacterium]
MRIPLVLIGPVVFVSLASAADPAPVPQGKVDFNREVRAILANNCLQCHGPDEKARKAKLRLDIREDAIKAGAFVPGKPDESELIKRVCSKDEELRMPPAKLKKPAITAAEIAVLKRWIAEGANYSDHWSFTPLKRPAVPKIDNPPFAVRNAIDNFILYRLQQEGVKPAAEADRVTLIRRLYFDLTGLPPSTEEVRAFVADKSPDAYEKLVEKLLASPHYGERLAVWWLDLVRYADSAGYHSDNPINVSPFRDYVIKSFNTNKPFDQFTIEQLAGDLLPNATIEQRVGSAYNRLLQTTEEGGAQAKEYEAKYSADRVRNYGQVWLGGTIMCAECHNHKFDPYTQADFYSVAAFFADIQEPSIGNRGPGTPVPTPEHEAKLKVFAEAIATAQAKLEAAAKEFAAKPEAFDDVEKWTSPAVAKKGPAVVVVPADVKAIIAKKPAERTSAEVTKLAAFAQVNAPALKSERDAIAAATKARADFDKTVPHVLMSISGNPRTVRLLNRGNWQDDTGPVMTPKTPGFLPPMPAKADPKARYTRLDLAKWSVSAENPLTSRVTVNRLWKLFYGNGIARSLEESGTQGTVPSHPELLDWLATEFQTKWDVRHMIRLMVTSSAYRQSSAETPAIRERDLTNRLFARQTRGRLDAEFVRDTALAVSGLLNRDIGGASVKPYQPAGYWSALNFPTREWQKDAGEKVYRRGMYTHWQRSFPHPAMVAFDAPSREEAACDRPRSNIPQQALVLLNDPEFVEAARVFAQHTLEQGGKDDATRIAWAFERATGRKPNDKEAAVLTTMLAKHRTDFAAKPAEVKLLLAIGDTPVPKDAKPEEVAAWTNVCRVILNLHETITRQ